MLLDDFDNWIALPSNRAQCVHEDAYDNFSVFFQGDCVGKSPMDIVCDLAFQMYEMQVCLEGLIEDQENQ